MPVAKVATRSVTACSGDAAGQGLVVAALTKHVEFEAEVLGPLGGCRTGKLLDVADALLVLVHVRLVDEQVVAAGLLETQAGVFGAVRQQFFSTRACAVLMARMMAFFWLRSTVALSSCARRSSSCFFST